MMKIPDPTKTSTMVPKVSDLHSAKPSNSLFDQTRKLRIIAGGRSKLKFIYLYAMLT